MADLENDKIPEQDADVDTHEPDLRAAYEVLDSWKNSPISPVPGKESVSFLDFSDDDPMFKSDAPKAAAKDADGVNPDKEPDGKDREKPSEKQLELKTLGLEKAPDLKGVQDFSIGKEHFDQLGTAEQEALTKSGIERLSIVSLRAGGKAVLVELDKPKTVPMDPSSGCRNLTIDKKSTFEITQGAEGSLVIGNIKGMKATLAGDPPVDATIKKLEFAKDKDGNPELRITGAVDGNETTSVIKISGDQVEGANSAIKQLKSLVALSDTGTFSEIPKSVEQGNPELAVNDFANAPEVQAAMAKEKDFTKQLLALLGIAGGALAGRRLLRPLFSGTQPETAEKPAEVPKPKDAEAGKPPNASTEKDKPTEKAPVEPKPAAADQPSPLTAEKIEQLLNRVQAKTPADRRSYFADLANGVKKFYAAEHPDRNFKMALERTSVTHVSFLKNGESRLYVVGAGDIMHEPTGFTEVKSGDKTTVGITTRNGGTIPLAEAKFRILLNETGGLKENTAETAVRMNELLHLFNPEPSAQTPEARAKQEGARVTMREMIRASGNGGNSGSDKGSNTLRPTDLAPSPDNTLKPLTPNGNGPKVVTIRLSDTHIQIGDKVHTHAEMVDGTLKMATDDLARLRKDHPKEILQQVEQEKVVEDLTKLQQRMVTDKAAAVAEINKSYRELVEKSKSGGRTEGGRKVAYVLVGSFIAGLMLSETAKDNSSGPQLPRLGFK